jgi:hypothetical protein
MNLTGILKWYPIELNEPKVLKILRIRKTKAYFNSMKTIVQIIHLNLRGQFVLTLKKLKQTFIFINISFLTKKEKIKNVHTS